MNNDFEKFFDERFSEMSLTELAPIFGISSNTEYTHEELVLQVEKCIEVLCSSPQIPKPDWLLDPIPRMISWFFQKRETVSELDREITLCRQAIELFPPGHICRQELLTSLASALIQRCALQEELADLADYDEAIAHYGEMVPFIEPGDSNLLRVAQHVAACCMSLFSQHQNPDCLEAAISHYSTIIQHLPLFKDPDAITALCSLAGLLEIRYEWSKDITDLDLIIEYRRKALRLFPSDHQLYSPLRIQLFGSLHTRFLINRTAADRDESVQLQKAELSAYSIGDPARFPLLIKAGEHFVQYSDKTGTPIYLDDAISYLTEALDLIPTQHPMRPGLLIILATVHHGRFEDFELTDQLDQGLARSMEALDLCQPGSLFHIRSFVTVAKALQDRHAHSGNLEDLSDAIHYLDTAITLTQPNDTELGTRPSALKGLASCLIARYSISGDVSDIDRAILLSKEAASLDPSSADAAIHTLGNGFKLRFESSGNPVDLDQAIDYFREAEAMRSPTQRGDVVGLSSLAATLLARFELLSDKADLDEAFRYISHVLSTSSMGGKHLPKFLSILIIFIKNNPSVLGTNHTKLLVDFVRGILPTYPSPHPDRLGLVMILAGLLVNVFLSSLEDSDLDDAIKFNYEALELSRIEQAEYSRILHNLSFALRVRFQYQKNVSDLEEAIEVLHRAEASLPQDDPFHAKLAIGLMNAYQSRSVELQRPSDLEESLNFCEKATYHPTTGSMLRLVIANTWASRARNAQHKSTLRAYSAALSCLDRYTTIPHTLGNQQTRLAGAPHTLALNAASWAIAEGKVEKAVELLEQGRGIIWSQVGRFRTSLDQLKTVAPFLAVEFRRISLRMEKTLITSEHSPVREGSDYRLLSNQWNAVVEKIRKVEGLSDFLKATPFATLQQASINGPVIIVNIDEFRSDAVIIQHNCPPFLLPLPRATPVVVTSLASDLAAVSQSQDVVPTETTNAMVTKVLRCLWNIVVSPVVSVLKDTCGIRQGSRIWWCPTSALWSLPLHAAGPYKKGERNLPDLYVSSYTPTLSALLRATNRKLDLPTHVSPTLLVVGQPETPGVGALPHVREEIQQVQEHASAICLLEHEAATSDAVILGLQQCSWVHFACHGHQDLEQPFNSRFDLHDQPLPLIDIIQTGLPNAQFAFLSACHSAAGDRRTPNEAIHLAAGLQFAGYGGVVGTMWAMADVDGPIVAKEFYGYMFRNGGELVDYRDAATALNIATKALRRLRVPVERWINFIHIGA